jgi:hypothetical protein
MTLTADVPAAYPILTALPAIAQGDGYDPKEIAEGVSSGALEGPRARNQERLAGRQPREARLQSGTAHCAHCARRPAGLSSP